jgi:anti-sigma factor RsiW
MTGDGNAMQHADDGAIVQWIDGALSREERAALDTHFADCTECARRRATIVRRAQRLNGLLQQSDLPVPAPALRITLAQRGRRIPVQWGVAAVLVLALAGVVAVPEVRAWIIEVARAAWSRATGDIPATTNAAPQAGAVSFVPESATLTIRAPAQPGARLAVEVVVGDRVSAVGAGGRPLPGLTVLPDEVRLGDTGDSAAVYTVWVPVRLQAVRVIVGDGVAQVFRPSVVGERREFTLSP